MSTEKKAPEIKLLKQIPMAIASQRHLFKLFGTLCVIKHLWPVAPIVCGDPAYRKMSALSGESTDTMGRRVDKLIEIGWLKKRTAHVYDAISWDELAAAYKIPHQHFYEVPMTPGIKLHKIIAAKYEEEEIKACELAARMEIKCNPLLKEVVTEVTGMDLAHSNPREVLHRVAYHQLNCFVTEGFHYTDDQRYALNTIQKTSAQGFRADTAQSYITKSRKLGYKSRGGYARHMRSLAMLGLITKEHRIIPMRGHVHGEWYTNLGFPRWNESKGTMEIILPDLVTVLPITGLQTRHERMKLQLQHNPPPPPNPVISERVLRSWITRKQRQNETKPTA